MSRNPRAIGVAVGIALSILIPGHAARAAEVSPEGWTNRLVVTYATDARGALPSGTRLVHEGGRHAVVDLGRRAVPSDLARFRGAAILSVEPDLHVTATSTPNDPSYGLQWDMSDPLHPGGDFSVHAPGAWGVTTGSATIVVAVLDTGITDHAEFAGRTIAGYDMISDRYVANDGNGRDSDPHDPGDWITLRENASGYFRGCGAEDSSWHGTHVAGTIAATGNNGVGIAGLNWAAKIEPVRVLGKCGGYTSDIADAITWASGGSVSGVPANAHPARIISLSLGGSGSCPSYLQDAITGARDRGSLIVVAAGNGNEDAIGSNPANCSGTIVVAATARDGTRAYYSNYGSLVTIAAPGGDRYKDSMVLSTVNTGKTSPSRDGYAAYQGTSMATPHVSGVLSLLLSNSPSLTVSEVIDLMQSTATPFPTDSGSNPCSTPNNCGAGIINATALLGAVDPPPPPPPAAPAIAVDPSISGTPIVGTPLTAVTGSWSGSPEPSVTYKWLLCSQEGPAITSNRAPTDCGEIRNATAATYTPVSSNAGARLRFATKATNSQGSATRYSAASALVSGPPFFASPPSISGRAQVGKTLTAKNGSVAGLAPITFGYQWFSCVSRVRAASSTLNGGCNPTAISSGSPSFAIATAPPSPYIVVGVTATSGGSSTTSYSASVGPIR
jgi:subtilisin family serine protease